MGGRANMIGNTIAGCLAGLLSFTFVSLIPEAHAGDRATGDGWSVTVERGAPIAEDGNVVARRATGMTGPFRMRLGFDDKRAALQALQFALNEVADGATFVWHRKAGLLSGTVKPTAVFLDEDQRLCRHVVFTLNAGPRKSSIETIACRDEDGHWSM
ncbi:MAG: hypothetical protein AAFZ01_00680 [Pseudomonadota bacterium]